MGWYGWMDGWMNAVESMIISETDGCGMILVI